MAKRDVVRRIDFDGYAGASPKGVAVPVSGLTADQIQDMIDDAIEENNNSGGGSSPSITMSVTPADNITASGSVGDNFTSYSEVYTLTNTSTVSINWSITHLRSWVTVSSSSGTLAASATTTVTVSINGGASSLLSGEHSDVILFYAEAA